MFHLIFVMKKTSLKILCDVGAILMITKSENLLASVRSSAVFFTRFTTRFTIATNIIQMTTLMILEWLEYKLGYNECDNRHAQ